MRLGSELQNLEKQRAGELALLRSRFGTLSGALAGEGSPAQWVREHPYVATAGAALAGFAAAQLPGRWSRGSTGSSAASLTAGNPAVARDEFAGLLITLAKQVLPALADLASTGKPSDVVVSGGNAGTVQNYQLPDAVTSFARGVPAETPRNADRVLH